MQNFGYIQTKFNVISFKYVKEFLISTINRQFLFTCYLIFKKMVNYIYKFINSSHFLRAGTIIELHEVIFHSDYLVTSLFGYQISFGYMLTVICRFDDHIHLKNYMMLFDQIQNLYFIFVPVVVILSMKHLKYDIALILSCLKKQ